MWRPAGVGCIGVVATLSVATRRKLEHLTGDLQREFPHVPMQRIHDVVEMLAAEILDAARFDDYVPLLTHRHARERLREESGVLEPV
jgi:predicted subunit of tRNA(5-methylaminomethyl-2-thiouridylate) methyltransferase